MDKESDQVIELRSKLETERIARIQAQQVIELLIVAGYVTSSKVEQAKALIK